VVRATHPPLDDGERVHRLDVTFRVRPRLGDGALGEQSTVTATVSWKVSVLLDRGLEIPVVLDRVTGMVTAIPVDELTEELEPRFGESDGRAPGWSFDPF
jgi:hypothetical protein